MSDFEQKMSMVFNPIYQGSTVLYDNFDEFLKYSKQDIKQIEDVKEFSGYGRLHNPTVFELERILAKMEYGDFCKITTCGLSAITKAILTYAKNGDHVLMTDGAYIRTRAFAENILPKFGINYDYYDTIDINDLKSKIKSNTKIIFLELPSSGSGEFQDIAEIVSIAKEKNIITICDNTMMTPILFNPIKHGIDVVVHSLTKFVLGYSDCMLGCVITTKKHFKDLYDYTNLMGNHVNSENAYMAIRGLKTLELRVKDSVKRGKPIIDYLKSHELIKEILHLSCFEDERKTIAEKYIDCKKVASLMTIVLKKKYTNEELTKFFDNLKIFRLGFSWGGFESLCIPYDLSFRQNKIRNYKKNTCIRLYIGMEKTEALIEDLQQAMLKFK